MKIASMLAGDVSKMFFTRTWFSLPRWTNGGQSLADESHAWSRSELSIGDAQGIAPPAHVAGNDMPIVEYSLHDRDMAQSIGTLDPGLQHHDGSGRGTGRDAPAKLIGARHPLPGVGLCFPGNKDAVQLEITLIGPPGAGSIGEDVSRSDGRGMLLIGLPDVVIHLRDADKLPPVNTIRVGKPVLSS